MLSFDFCDLYRVVLGLNDGESHVQEINSDDAMTMVSLYVASHFDGATVTKGYGVYRHENGDIVREESIIIDLAFVTEFMVESLVKHLKQVFNQESVMVMKMNVGVQFYG